jgi:hypothetical protein
MPKVFFIRSSLKNQKKKCFNSVQKKLGAATRTGRTPGRLRLDSTRRFLDAIRTQPPGFLAIEKT